MDRLQEVADQFYAVALNRRDELGRDFKYRTELQVPELEACLYTDGLQPLCIVGVWAVQVVGVSNAWLRDNANGKILGDELLQLLGNYDHRTEKFVGRVQYYQDQNIGWVESVEKAASDHVITLHDTRNSNSNGGSGKAAG